MCVCLERRRVRLSRVNKSINGSLLSYLSTAMMTEWSIILIMVSLDQNMGHRGRAEN